MPKCRKVLFGVQTYKGIFEAETMAMFGACLFTLSLRVEGKPVKVQVWDVQRMNFDCYCAAADGFIVVREITEQDRFACVVGYAREIRRVAGDGAVVVVIGNKMDLDEKRLIRSQDGQQVTRDVGMEFVEASAKNGAHVAELGEMIIVKLMVEGEAEQVVVLRGRLDPERTIARHKIQFAGLPSF
jgi:GTPase SAR1 family protein